MSNEELVLAIQNGKSEYIEMLWDGVKRFVHIAAYNHFQKTNGRGGVTVDDLQQAGFIAMMDAIPRFTYGEASFITYLKQYLVKHFHEASGRIYGAADGKLYPKDALNVATSLNVFLNEEENIELLDLVADPVSGIAMVDESIWKNQRRNAIAKVLEELPENQQKAIRFRFWEELTYKQAGEEMQLCSESVRKLEAKALRYLKKPENSKRLKEFAEFNCYAGTGLGSFKSTGSSIQERYLMIKERYLAEKNRIRKAF